MRVNMIEILMIEDDEEITELLREYLSQYGMSVRGFAKPSLALNSLEIDSYDLIILDLSLPEMDGLELCRVIREKFDTPLIISSARGDLSDKVTGLELGADDYLPKPYEPRELVARIKSLLRRYKKSFIESQSDFRVDEDKMQIFKDDNLLELTLAEYEILKLLIEKRDLVISREFIANNVNSINWDSSDKSINVIISRVRQKIGDNPKNPKYIKSIRGVGYKFVG